MSKIEKTIARQQEKIEEGQFYEAHQQLRVIASRYVKQSNWSAATDILSSGAQLLLKAGQGGSGGDLGLYLIDVYTKSSRKPDAASKARVISLMRGFPAGEPTRKRFINEAVAWTSRLGEFPAGDPEIHHVAGVLYADGVEDSLHQDTEDEPYDAEKHLILGTKDSPETLSKLLYTWYTEDEPSTAPFYASRAVLPYLLIGNLRAANKSHLLFTSQLQSIPHLATQTVESKTSDLRIYPSLPLLNFLGLLLLAVQRGSPELFRMLKSQYKTQLAEVPAWSEPLDQVGEMYFGIKIPSQGNPLMDMMSGMLMGGGGQPKKKPRTVGAAAPTAPGVD
ncbi:DUF410-domain-containing protein [Tothia fuscella]|uniref:DUF410-domain-containing protein n=1 Tax=Tothia fuscella TaxID=1048955 RepID=A0A9P4TXJ9_9PEZI|nr:DUF410-domain-containing protein [Tothia fuscella]